MRIKNNTYHPTKGSLTDFYHIFLSCWGVFSLTELTDLTEHFCALFRSHEEVAPPPTPPPQGGA